MPTTTEPNWENERRNEFQSAIRNMHRDTALCKRKPKKILVSPDLYQALKEKLTEQMQRVQERELWDTPIAQPLPEIPKELFFRGIRVHESQDLEGYEYGVIK